MRIFVIYLFYLATYFDFSTIYNKFSRVSSDFSLLAGKRRRIASPFSRLGHSFLDAQLQFTMDFKPSVSVLFGHYSLPRRRILTKLGRTKFEKTT